MQSTDLADGSTVENHVLRAAYEAGLVLPSNAGSLDRLHWSRSSRTDKGVHAQSTVCLLHPGTWILNSLVTHLLGAWARFGFAALAMPVAVLLMFPSGLQGHAQRTACTMLTGGYQELERGGGCNGIQHAEAFGPSLALPQPCCIFR